MASQILKTESFHCYHETQELKKRVNYKSDVSPTEKATVNRTDFPHQLSAQPPYINVFLSSDKCQKVQWRSNIFSVSKLHPKCPFLSYKCWYQIHGEIFFGSVFSKCFLLKRSRSQSCPWLMPLQHDDSHLSKPELIVNRNVYSLITFFLIFWYSSQFDILTYHMESKW